MIEVFGYLFQDLYYFTMSTDQTNFSNNKLEDTSKPTNDNILEDTSKAKSDKGVMRELILTTTSV